MSGFGIQDITVNDSVNTVNTENNSFQTLTGVGLINIVLPFTYIVNSGGNYVITLPNSTNPGKQKTIIVTENPSLSFHNITLEYNDAYGNQQLYILGQIGDVFIFMSTTLGWQLIQGLPQEAPVVLSRNFVAYNFQTEMLFQGQVVSQGSSPVFERGVVYNTTGNPTLADNIATDSGTGLGNYDVYFSHGYAELFYARAYAINSVDVSYGPVLSATPQICLVKGTMITLFNKSTKPIEDIEYTDELLVWNFDEGKFDSAKPLWIKKTEKARWYNHLKFSDNTELKTINQHRIFNEESGKFTYPMTDDTPIGTTTFNHNGEKVKLIEKDSIVETVDYYNIITEFHINMFANGILTSCRYNNVYPIKDMKFVKDPNRTVITDENYKHDIFKKYFNGLRLHEQDIDLDSNLNYICRLEMLKK